MNENHPTHSVPVPQVTPQPKVQQSKNTRQVIVAQREEEEETKRAQTLTPHHNHPGHIYKNGQCYVTTNPPPSTILPTHQKHTIRSM